MDAGLFMYTIAEAKEQQKYWEGVAKSNHILLKSVARCSGLGGELVSGGRMKAPIGWEIIKIEKGVPTGELLAGVAAQLVNDMKVVSDKLSEHEVLTFIADSESLGFETPNNEYWERFCEVSREYIGKCQSLGNAYIYPGLAEAELGALNYERWTLWQRIVFLQMEKADRIASRLFNYRRQREGREGEVDEGDAHPKGWTRGFLKAYPSLIRQGFNPNFRAPWE
ncbi:hypothetical protein QBC44DRAFT_401960 [Cladorrhinum sp. PSN332]|nr:hypothetical protein QBC44DRAFT_401960 [Cladorrhinum sp. PSN332]